MREAVTVISDTIQEFLGVRYYLCGKYFQKGKVRLHRAVWEHHNGPIPKGHDVHHHTHDRSRNQIEDLELKTKTKHMADHGRERDPEWLKQFAEKGRVSAAEWHGSEEGRKWHSDHFEKSLREVHTSRVMKQCQECGTDYQAGGAQVKRSQFCGGTCKARARRRRLRDEAAFDIL